jgi:hypothetical protein
MEKTPSIQIESTRVAFEMADGRVIRLPPGYGTFHDPTGKLIPKCTIYFGPFKKTGRRVEMTREQRRYFGPEHKAYLAVIPNLKEGGWKVLGKAVQIFYFRRGQRARGGYFHPFVHHPGTLSKAGRIYKLNLGSCLVDDRGYVYP